jgi:hypothetical protein
MLRLLLINEVTSSYFCFGWTICLQFLQFCSAFLSKSFLYHNHFFFLIFISNDSIPIMQQHILVSNEGMACAHRKNEI